MSSKKSKKQARHKVDGEFGGVRRIDFKNVFTVINFDMPENSAGYIHRIGRTGRAFNTGVSVSLKTLLDTFTGLDEQEEHLTLVYLSPLYP
ncbi:DEAD-box ATP-dependent RNA helicase 16-like isoform X4 [Zingiber officinale]|uniref:DEAD-box ATP-dependent RNA helicase 16-like isoform X4 n=1 Tax=Zingiber officinale TaxID=94328 RepID=UPI001C4D08B9|nr:DEAD-box ATP-dependent RNA helicase 16-like isoform X4 [Zingiber officinale]